MEEKKKRTRPTWTQVKALEADVAMLRGNISELKKEYSELLSERDTLLQSNRLMDDELERLRHSNAQLRGLSDERGSEIREIRKRGFWDRVFNR